MDTDVIVGWPYEGAWDDFETMKEAWDAFLGASKYCSDDADAAEWNRFIPTPAADNIGEFIKEHPIASGLAAAGLCVGAGYLAGKLIDEIND